MNILIEFVDISRRDGLELGRAFYTETSESEVSLGTSRCEENRRLVISDSSNFDPGDG